MANVERDNNMMNEEQESSQSNSSNGSGATPQQHQNQTGFQLKSSILRQPATFGSGAGAGGGLFGSGSSATGAGGFNLKPSVLKPSHFGGSAFQNSGSSGGSNSFGSNPFLKTQASEEEAPEQQQQPESSSSDGTGKTEKDDPLGTLNRPTLPKSNLFANVKSISENTGFVFGQNVHERVTGAGENLETSATPTAGLSFSSTVASTANNSNDSSSSNSTNAPTASQQSGGAATAAAAAGSNGGGSGDKPESMAEESLEEAARKYEESRGALKRKFDEVETITGEEDERNVAEINCKLFAFAKSNWEERGHGTLRLNDKDGSSKESRVVFRQSGNLRVLINTKVWSGMIADQSSQKSLRLTAMDNNGQVKVFLVMSRPDVIGKLHKELTKRIQTAKELAAATGENDDDADAGKENNNDDHVSSAAAAKPSEDDEHTHATPPVVVVVEKDSSGDAAVGEDEPPSAKKRLSAAAASP